MSWLPTSRVHCPFVARLHTWNTCARLALTLRPIHIVECKLEGQVTESQDLGNLFCNGETHPFITPLLSPHCLSVFQLIYQTPAKLIPFTSPCHPSINQSIAVRTKSLSANKLEILIKILALNYAQQSNPHLRQLEFPSPRHCHCPTVRLSGVKYLKISASVFRPKPSPFSPPIACLPFYCFTTVGQILWLAKSFALMVIQLSVIYGGFSKDPAADVQF